MERESRIFIETFLNPDDAHYFLERHMAEHGSDEWKIEEYRINLIGGVYRAGITFVKVKI